MAVRGEGVRGATIKNKHPLIWKRVGSRRLEEVVYTQYDKAIEEVYASFTG